MFTDGRSFINRADTADILHRNANQGKPMERTTNLSLPYIMPSQAQKHVTHNEAIRALDLLVHLSVADRNRTAPPPAPAEGDCHIVGPAPTDDWAGREQQIATVQEGAWMYYPPRPGWHAWLRDEQRLVVFDGTSWVTAEPAGPTGGAFAFRYDDDVNIGDPGPGRFRLNNSTPELSTALCLSAGLTDGSDIGALVMARFGASAAVGCRVIITSGASRLEFDATAAADHAQWLELTVSEGMVVGDLSDGDQCEIVLLERGEQGVSGFERSLSQAVATGSVDEGGWYLAGSLPAAIVIARVHAEVLASSGGAGAFTLHLKSAGETSLLGPAVVAAGAPLTQSVDLDFASGAPVVVEIDAVDDVQSYQVEIWGHYK